jgi:TetR/AcrR family transcriptional repressor of lmrAB and yxaGH operons
VESVAIGAAETRAALQFALTAADGPQAALDQAADLFAAGLLASEFHDGCPVATVALEAAADGEPLRAACAQAYHSWIEVIVGAFGQWGVPESRREELATVVLAAVEGALLLARIQRDIAPLRAVARHVGALITAIVTDTDYLESSCESTT